MNTTSRDFRPQHRRIDKINGGVEALSFRVTKGKRTICYLRKKIRYFKDKLCKKGEGEQRVRTKGKIIIKRPHI